MTNQKKGQILDYTQATREVIVSSVLFFSFSLLLNKEHLI